MYEYIILQDSTGSGGKYRVPQGGYKPIIEKSVSEKKLADGGIDVCQGGIYEVHEYMLFVRDTETEDGYANRDELERIYRLNDPTASPSDQLTFTDHYGNTHTAVIVSRELMNNAVTTLLTGTEAWYMIPIRLRILP